MAGENVLVTEMYPDDFQVTNIPFITPATGAKIPILYSEARVNAGSGIVVDRVTVIIQSFTGSSTYDVKSATDAACSAGVQTLNSSQLAAAVGFNALTLSATANFVPSGSGLFLVVGGTVTAVVGCVQVRWRSRQK